nr:hypothetical protein CFP56_62555 [Quercus suber]
MLTHLTLTADPSLKPHVLSPKLTHTDPSQPLFSVWVTKEFQSLLADLQVASMGRFLFRKLLLDDSDEDEIIKEVVMETS